jgi:translation initiation factor 1 (eIF-1/SUI1)
MYKYIDIRVIGLQDTLLDFGKLMKTIQKCGERGTCSKIPVVVDGDGSGKLKFQILEEGIQPEDMDTSKTDLIETEGKVLEDIWIGE